ncbi:putative metallophosphoesterase [Golovinomyces cichoracearum]|uniref:Putative metallophosphoesterase n=1 Tax=Golovinomyces cichoracearum TaxID=62708 RepID=A0A420IJM0_9PEZI|nr:putative metallophosphoesterase [Golovinomyces cichoracearum]
MMKTEEDASFIVINTRPLSPIHESPENEFLHKESSRRYVKEQDQSFRTRYRPCLLKLLAIGLLLFWTGYELFTSEWSRTMYGQQKAWLSSCLYHQRPDPIRIGDLPSDMLPTTSGNRDPRRLVVVGDTHGMKDSLVRLLDEVKFNSKQDHLILVGDLVAKGPDSAGVLDLAYSLGASCVRGNHEDQVIQAWNDMQQAHQSFTDTTDNNETNSESTGYDKKHELLAMNLGRRRIEWIKTWPTILRVGKMGDLGEVIVAHAGLEPGVALKNQDPFMVMNMRSIKHNVLTDKHHGKSWSKKWNKYQKSLHQSKRQTVIYGHDAKRGLQIKHYSLGIDSGCVKGKKLTAAVLEGDKNGFTYSLVQIKC